MICLMEVFAASVRALVPGDDQDVGGGHRGVDGNEESVCLGLRRQVDGVSQDGSALFDLLERAGLKALAEAFLAASRGAELAIAHVQLNLT